MWKALVVVAVTANTFLITPTEANKRCRRPNEVFDLCPAPCPPRECGVNIAATLCAPAPKIGDPTCRPSCRCADGFLRNKTGICIPEAQCPPECPENEIFDTCPAPCPPLECGVNKALILCAPGPKPGDPQCAPSCRCADGFLRNKAGKCIPENECPFDCPVNEVYDICPAPCPPLRCGVNRALIRCAAPPKPGDPNCKPSCRCADGFLRNNEGTCIPEAQCPRKCPKNEVFDVCPAPCPPLECGVNKALIRCAAPPKPGDPNCKPSCRCADGFLRNKAGVCVPEAECPSPCGTNEELSPCSNGGCGPWTCSDLGFPTGCVKMDLKYCKEGCVCKEGFVKNDNGTCIPSTECPECGGDSNAIAGCGINCGRLCSNYNKGPVSCTEECLRNACDCREGFVLDKYSNKCVRPFECKCNQPNEYYDPCPPKCPKQVCESIGKTHKCPITTAVCEGECRCYKGYFRNKIGQCIKGDDCLQCTGPNEYFSCGGACDNVCATINKQNKTSCPIVNIQCNSMCYCEEGYARDANNICIPVEKCPAPQCKDDERYEECPAWLVNPQTCSQIGLIECPEIPRDTSETCPEPPACVCDYDLVRNDEGKCVPPNQCPPVCKNNEVYDSCANAGCEKRNCSQLGLPDFCTDVTQCIGGCVCAKGFLRTENGTCIPEKQCPIPTCPNPKRERFEWCPGGQCSPQSCSEVGFPLQCPEISDSSNCQGPPRCVCKDGYVRNSNGRCISIKKCPSCGGDPNAVSGCGTNSCNRLCSNYDKPPVPCPRICRVNACDCKPGLVFDENLKICVPPNKCTPQCKPGERYEQCPDWLCTPQTCSQVGFPIACPGISGDDCVSCPGSPACVCDNNYVRNDEGDCIPSNQCPSCGGDPNAVSGCGVNCGRLCSNYNRTDIACIAVCYPNACDCKKGYVLDKNINQCVRPTQCTQVCGLNEIYDTCSNGGCQKRNCSQLGQPDVCINVKKCSGGCVCQEGFLRTKEGNCVPQKECPIPTCPNNERFVWCPDTLCTPQSCTDVGFPVPCPILAEDSGCPGPPRCVCNEGYARNSDGKCVPVKQCPSCGGDPNAVSGCGTNRCNKLCSNYDKPRVPCPKICMVNACDCNKGYVFDKNINKCVLPKQCSPICGPDEVFSECIEGGSQAVNCSQLGKPVPCKLVPQNSCTKGCLCKEGYLRTDDGVCVPQEQCNQCHRPNEYYDPCPPRCPPQTCESIGKTYKCPITTAVCKGACRCNKGYFRNKIGECIKGHDCLQCRGPHEYFSCGGACDNVCLTLSQQNQTNCPIVNIKCNPMCYCENGYARDENKICVPIEKCPVSCGGDPHAKPGCGVNCGKRCSDYNKKPAFCPLICKVNGCDCKDGFVHDDNLKKCVLPEDCTPVCKTNEVYDTCANGGCQNRNCSQFGQPTLCIDPIKCNGGCVCQTGYLRAENGTCVPENQCPGICRKPHEFYDPCPPICPPQTCESLNKTYFCPANIVNGTKLCRSACRCKDGFFRDSVGQCILKRDCFKCRGPHEYFSCGGACDNVCLTLSQQNQTNCPIVNIKCNPMCYCENGYARDENNICVPIEKCPVSCGGDPHAKPGCGVNCGKRCSDYNKKPAFCPLICKVNGCDCKDGFVHDDNLKKCVLPEDCTPVCKTNEVYDTCANGGCQNRNCSQFGQPTLCIDPIKCNGGCVCQTGYLRAENGTCVPENQCPGICRKPHEFYDPCPPICPPQTCKSLNKTYSCPANIVNGTKICRSACRCKEGFFRDSVGQCILKRDCLKCTGPNEYFACGGACDNVCETLDKQNQTNCPIRNIKCNPMCYCNEGYARDDKKICVPIEQCPEICNKPHEVFKSCPSTCPPQTCESLGKAYICPIVTGQEPPCNPGCVCEESYYRNKLGECVTEKECAATSTTSPPTAVNRTEATERLNNGVIIASGKFLYQLASKSPNDNIILSATSVIIALAQLSLFTAGLVLKQLLNFFNLKGKDEVRAILPEFIKSYQNQTHVDFSAVTKYYADKEYPLSAYFKEESKKILNSTGENLDFTKAEEAARIINKWVNDNTNGKIQDLVKAEMFGTDTRLVLVNAIYFLGNWVYQFNPNNTENKDFYKSNGDTVTVEMMYQKNNFDYTENDQYQTLKMRYKGNAFSCVVVLPRKKDGLLETIKILQNPEEFKNMLKKLRRQEVEVNIPKMLIKTEMNIAEMLQKENVTAMFNPNNKNFDGILEKKQDLFVSAAVQQAYLSFNEVGTEATAATAIIIGVTSVMYPPPKPIVFNANRPYAFYILFNDVPIFCGSFVGAK